MSNPSVPGFIHQDLVARVEKAIALAVQYGGIDGDHHKAWVIDQMVRALCGCPMVEATAIDCNGKEYRYDRRGESKEYLDTVANAKAGPNGPDTWDWDEGIAP